MNFINHTEPNAVTQRCYVTAKYLAEKYNVTERYIHILATSGRIPSLELGKKCRRFDEDAVAAALEGPREKKS